MVEAGSVRGVSARSARSPPSYFGDSIGHWEGETLVVDTVGYNEKFWFIRGGLPHTRFMHLTERFTRLDLTH